MVTQIFKKQIERIEYREKNIFWIFFCIFIFFLFSYGFIVNKTIANAINKQQMEEEILILNSDINSMESSYLSLKKDVTIDLAIAKGFIKNSQEKYAVVSINNSLSLSVNEN
ncbi:MAG: hypothetical protein PHN69_00575 [Candidatus Pacebacteria bacterium]|nr:hypothetical protein [Candidatus Paceibacterota bacterium]